MNSFLVRGLLRSYRAIYARKLRTFEKSLSLPELAQERALTRILRHVHGTEYARGLHLSSKMSIAEYRSRVPIVTYEDLLPWIERQKQSRDAILTPSIVSFEKTSGSRGSAKWIPYNRAHLATFNEMFILWSLNLLREGLRLETGRTFFLISPHSPLSETTAAGIPVGFDTDADYLGGLSRRMGDLFFLNSRALAQSQDYIRDLARLLAGEPDLEVISVWSPSLLLLVLDVLGQKTTQLWPKLKLISCWASGTSREDYERLRALFPHVRIQGKGLLATEAAMTLPWKDRQLPLVDSLFFEFQCESSGRVLTLSEVELGGHYKILLSAANGFLRYSIGDRVRIGPEIGATPTIEFLGRDSEISDLVGEKLNSMFVEDSLRELSYDHFAIVVPDFVRPGYVLLTTGDDLQSQLEAKFETQYHYALARRRGQLQPLRSLQVPNLRSIYYSLHESLGLRAGQVKHRSLVTSRELATRLLTASSPKASRAFEATFT